jgi:hypothetical protein
VTISPIVWPIELEIFAPWPAHSVCLFDFCSAFQSCTVRAFCGCARAGLLRKFLKLVDRSLDREPLVDAGMEWGLLDMTRFMYVDAIQYEICMQ